MSPGPKPRCRALLTCAPLILLLQAREAHAWAIGSQFNVDGCHERITASALRAVRTKFDTAPTLTPSRDEAAMIRDVLFAPPEDLVHDLAAMTLMLGVRDPDLKGIDPLSSLDLIQVHGSPTTQDEHCIRSSEDDDAAGNETALAACRAFIIRTATEALEGLDANGTVDATNRTPLVLYVAIRGRITPSLPLFYLRIAAAMHAVEDGFPHTYRTADGMKVTTVLNWIDLTNGSYSEGRDGPTHRAELDRCWESDPILERNYELATQAATELLSAALDPGLTREQKIEQFELVAAKYFAFESGCTLDNHWCDSGEAGVTNSITGCNVAGTSSFPLWIVLVSSAVIVIGRRRRTLLLGCALLVSGALAPPARADDPPPLPTEPADAKPPPTPTEEANAKPGVPIPAAEPTPADGSEPGRDVKTPTVGEVASVREDKKLGNPWGVTGSLGGAVDRPAVVVSAGVRYRITERWIVGLDAAWNPWLTTSPMAVRTGVATMAAVVTRRFPMKFDRVNLRSSFYVGTSTLLFDVYGAPQYSTGPYIALSPLGIDYDLGGAVRLIWDPMEMALPIPLVGQLPLYYEQFRFMLGIQIGG